MTKNPNTKYGHAITSKLNAADRARIERIAEREQRPLGNMFRILALKAADDYEQSLQSATTATPPAAA